jgi:MOSC domain-containing protein YiiM
LAQKVFVAGTILQVNISRGGLPKRPIQAGFIGPLGVEGDLHDHPQLHGGPRKAVLIIASEIIDELQGRGYPVVYGALGENLTTRGLDLRDVRIGDRVRAGGAMLEITVPRIPCRQLDVYGPSIQQEIYDPTVKALDASSPHWGMSGFYASVLAPGPVGAGDPIEVLAKMA